MLNCSITFIWLTKTNFNNSSATKHINQDAKLEVPTKVNLLFADIFILLSVRVSSHFIVFKLITKSTVFISKSLIKEVSFSQVWYWIIIHNKYEF